MHNKKGKTYVSPYLPGSCYCKSRIVVLGEQNNKFRTFSDFASDCDSTIVAQDNDLGNRESQAITAPILRSGLVGAVETVKDVLQLFICHTCTGILNTYRNGLPFFAKTDRNLSASRCIFHRIVHKDPTGLFH